MTDSPFMKRQAESRIGVAGRTSEARTAKRLGARLTPASGSLGAKGYMDLGDFKIEAKSTMQSRAPFGYNEVRKIKHEAGHAGKSPAITVTFTDTLGKPLTDGRWVLIEEDLFKRLIES